MNLSPKMQAKQKNRDDLVQELEQAGAKIDGKKVFCPYHQNQNTAAGSIHQAEDGTWRYKCFSCGVKGDLFDLIALRRGIEPADVIKEEAQKENQTTEAPRESQKKKPVRVESLARVQAFKLKQNPPEAVYRYTDPHTKKIRMVVSRYREASGAKTFLQWRPDGEGFLLKAPERPWPIYNQTRVGKSQVVVLVEGEKCVHALHKVGIVATTSPGGSKNFASADWSPLAGKTVYVWPDADDPGHDYAAGVIEILEKLDPVPTIKQVDPYSFGLSEGDDAADVIEGLWARHPDATPEQIKSSVSAVLKSATDAGPSEELREYAEAIIRGDIRMEPWPWPILTRTSSALLPGSIVLLCGSPGATKSLFILQALAWWTANDIRSAVFELEEDRTFHLNRCLAQLAGNSYLNDMKYIEQHPEESRQALAKYSEDLDRIGRHIWTTTAGEEVVFGQLAAWCEERAKEGNRILVIDPITSAGTGNDNIWDASRKFMYALKKIVTQYKATALLITHPSKNAGKEKGAPDLGFLSGGAAFGRFCSSALWLERKEQDQEAAVVNQYGMREMGIYNRIVRILKARNGPGQGSKIGYQFDPRTLITTEVGLTVD